MRTPAQKRADTAYKKRLRTLGLTLTSVWIPRSRVAELHEIAERMREEHRPNPVEINPPATPTNEDSQ